MPGRFRSPAMLWLMFVRVIHGFGDTPPPITLKENRP